MKETRTPIGMSGEGPRGYEKPAITHRQEFETRACGGCVPGFSGPGSHVSGRCDSGHKKYRKNGCKGW
jgi:hypothetical protein